MSKYRQHRSRRRRARYLLAMGLLVLATAACSAGLGPGSGSPVTPDETPVVEAPQPPVPPAASQFQPTSIEPAAEEEPGDRIKPGIARPMELTATKASAGIVVPTSEQPTKIGTSGASKVDTATSVSVKVDAATTNEPSAEVSTRPQSPNESVAEPIAASMETDSSSETATSILPRRLHVGGQARMLDALEHRSAGVSEADIAKTITIDIRRDEEYRYYFEPLEPLEVPAGETVKFVVRNIHFDSSDCW